MSTIDSITGCMLGTAVGDSIGLPREGVSRRRAQRIYGNSQLRQRLLFGRGMISDDTEHTCMVAQALLASGGDPDRFAQSLAWRLRGWLAVIPAGVGLATLKSIARLWIGYSWRNSGAWSAGNGPAMRAPIIGVFAGDDDELLYALVNRSTRMTHTDPLAEQGALLIAKAARHAARAGENGVDWERYIHEVSGSELDKRFLAALDNIQEHLNGGASVGEFANALGLADGVSGYVLHTVPVCLFSWLRHHDDFHGGVEAVIKLGGDADTTGAIVGGLLGAGSGQNAIPREWLDRLLDWPRSVKWMTHLAERLAGFADDRETPGPLPLCWPGILPRNLLFMSVVLVHGFRRLFPPY